MAEKDAVDVSVDAGAEAPAAEPPDSKAAASPAPAPPARPWLLAAAWIVANALAGLLASFFSYIGSEQGFDLFIPGSLAAVVALQLLVVWTFLGKRRVLFFWALALVLGLGVGMTVVFLWLMSTFFSSFAGPVSYQRELVFILEAGSVCGVVFLLIGVGQAAILAHVTGKRRRCWVTWLLSSFAGGVAFGVLLGSPIGYRSSPGLLAVPLFAYSLVTAAPLAMLSRHIPATSQPGAADVGGDSQEKPAP